jgi:hypothetical protein
LESITLHWDMGDQLNKLIKWCNNTQYECVFFFTFKKRNKQTIISEQLLLYNVCILNTTYKALFKLYMLMLQNRQNLLAQNLKYTIFWVIWIAIFIFFNVFYTKLVKVLKSCYIESIEFRCTEKEILKETLESLM